MISRAFVAVAPPPRVLDAIDAHVRRCSFAGWRRSRREQWHLTLDFLGGVDNEVRVIDGLDVLGRGTAPFRLALGGAGAFPEPGKAKVVWLGVVDGARELGALATVVRTALRSSEARPFHPHVTLARSDRPRAAAPLVDALDASPVGPSWEVDAVELVSSETHPSGARYTTVARLALSG